MAVVGVLLASGVLRAPDAGAQEGSVKAIFKKHDLLGMFAFDCSSPASKSNVYFVNRLLDANHVQRDQMSGPTSRDLVTIIDKAIELTADEISIGGKRDDEQSTESVWRFDKDRVLGVENTVGGKKVISGGKWTSNGQNVPPLSKCNAAGTQAQSPGSPQAGPDIVTVNPQATPTSRGGQASVKAIFEKHDLLGTFAADCRAPVSKDNLYFVNRVLDEAHVQRDEMSGPTTRDWATIIGTAVELTQDEISVSGDRNGVRSEIVWRLQENRTRGVESTLGGKKLIAGGKWISNGQETPWVNKCDTPGAQGQSSPRTPQAGSEDAPRGQNVPGAQAQARTSQAATVVAPVGATIASLTATAQSGVKTKVSEHVGFDKSCAPQHVVVKITTPPANGNVTTAEENSVLPANTTLGGAQPCAGYSAPTAVLYYESEPKFKGLDQFKYQRINEDNPKDRLNGEIILTVTVK